MGKTFFLEPIKFDLYLNYQISMALGLQVPPEPPQLPLVSPASQLPPPARLAKADGWQRQKHSDDLKASDKVDSIHIKTCKCTWHLPRNLSIFSITVSKGYTRIQFHVLSLFRAWWWHLNCEMLCSLYKQNFKLLVEYTLAFILNYGCSSYLIPTSLNFHGNVLPNQHCPVQLLQWWKCFVQ